MEERIGIIIIIIIGNNRTDNIIIINSKIKTTKHASDNRIIKTDS